MKNKMRLPEYHYIDNPVLKKSLVKEVQKKQAKMIKPTAGPRISGPILPGVPHYIGRQTLNNISSTIEKKIKEMERTMKDAENNTPDI